MKYELESCDYTSMYFSYECSIPATTFPYLYFMVLNNRIQQRIKGGIKRNKMTYHMLN